MIALVSGFEAPILGLLGVLGVLGFSLATLVVWGATIAVGVGITWVAQRMAAAGTFARIHRWLPTVQVVVWIVVAWRLLAPLFVAAEEGERWAIAIAIAIAALSSVGFLRNVFTGIVVAAEHRFDVGDDVRVGEIEGRILGLGVRSLQLRSRDGTETIIPYWVFSRSAVVRLALEALDAPCEFRVPVPAGVSGEVAIALAREAASDSPYASPRVPPDVFLALAADGDQTRLVLHIRGFVFDRDHEEPYRSDVSVRLHTAMTHAVTGA